MALLSGKGSKEMDGKDGQKEMERKGDGEKEKERKGEGEKGKKLE